MIVELTRGNVEVRDSDYVIEVVETCPFTHEESALITDATLLDGAVLHYDDSYGVEGFVNLGSAKIIREPKGVKNDKR